MGSRSSSTTPRWPGRPTSPAGSRAAPDPARISWSPTSRSTRSGRSTPVRGSSPPRAARDPPRDTARPAGGILDGLGADALHAPLAAVLRAGDPVGGGPGVGLGDVPVLVYTVNEAGPSGPAPRLAALGVSGLFTDDPASFASSPSISRSGGRTTSRSDIAGRPGDGPSGGTIPPPSRPGSSPGSR